MSQANGLNILGVCFVDGWIASSSVCVDVNNASLLFCKSPKPFNPHRRIAPQRPRWCLGRRACSWHSCCFRNTPWPLHGGKCSSFLARRRQRRCLCPCSNEGLCWFMLASHFEDYHFRPPLPPFADNGGLFDEALIIRCRQWWSSPRRLKSICFAIVCCSVFLGECTAQKTHSVLVSSRLLSAWLRDLYSTSRTIQRVHNLVDNLCLGFCNVRLQNCDVVPDRRQVRTSLISRWRDTHRRRHVAESLWSLHRDCYSPPSRSRWLPSCRASCSSLELGSFLGPPGSERAAPWPSVRPPLSQRTALDVLAQSSGQCAASEPASGSRWRCQQLRRRTATAASRRFSVESSILSRWTPLQRRSGRLFPGSTDVSEGGSCLGFQRPTRWNVSSCRSLGWHLDLSATSWSISSHSRMPSQTVSRSSLRGSFQVLRVPVWSPCNMLRAVKEDVQSLFPVARGQFQRCAWTLANELKEMLQSLVAARGLPMEIQLTSGNHV